MFLGFFIASRPFLGQEVGRRHLRRGQVDDDGRLLPEVLAARRRGVWLDSRRRIPRSSPEVRELIREMSIANPCRIGTASYTSGCGSGGFQHRRHRPQPGTPMTGAGPQGHTSRPVLRIPLGHGTQIGLRLPSLGLQRCAADTLRRSVRRTSGSGPLGWGKYQYLGMTERPAFIGRAKTSVVLKLDLCWIERYNIWSVVLKPRRITPVSP
jgi:hypothetical protein